MKIKLKINTSKFKICFETESFLNDRLKDRKKTNINKQTQINKFEYLKMKDHKRNLCDITHLKLISESTDLV